MKRRGGIPLFLYFLSENNAINFEVLKEWLYWYLTDKTKEYDEILTKNIRDFVTTLQRWAMVTRVLIWRR